MFPVTESELVARLQRGDQTALDGLYVLHADRLLRTIYLITGSRAAAEDAVHDAFVEVLGQIRRLRDPGRFRPWLYRIAVNKAKRTLRRGGLEAGRGDQASEVVSPSAEESVVLDGERKAVLLAVGQLDDAHRIPVVLRYYAGLTDSEIAEQMEIPVGTVKSRLFHARKQLLLILDAGERRARDA